MLRIAAGLAALAFISCISSQAPGVVPAYLVRARLRDVSIGQSIDEAHAALDLVAVRNPNDEDAPLPSPIHVLERFDGQGRSIRVEIYIVGIWQAEGCPDFHYQDIPVTYIEGRVVAKDWKYLEWTWQRFGGSLGELRAAQDRFRCDDATR